MGNEFVKGKFKGFPSLDYTMYFSTPLSVYYIGSFPGRLSTASNEKQFEAICYELDMALTMYALLIYHLYPKNEIFRNQIQQSDELRSNFEMMKKGLDKLQGGQMTDEYLKSIKSEADPGGRNHG